MHGGIMDLVGKVKEEMRAALPIDTSDNVTSEKINKAIYSLMLARLDPKQNIEKFKQGIKFICLLGSGGLDSSLQIAYDDVKALIEISSESQNQESGRGLDKVVAGLNTIYDMFNDQNDLHYGIFNYLKAENTDVRKEKLRGFYNLCLLADIVHTSKRKCNVVLSFDFEVDFTGEEKITLVNSMLTFAQKAGNYFLAEHEPIVTRLVLDSFYKLHTNGKLTELFADNDRFQNFGKQIEKYADRNRTSFESFHSVLSAFVADYVTQAQSK